MARSGGSVNVTYIDTNKTLDFEECLDKYSKVLEDINDKVQKCKKQENNVCKECLNLCEYINNKEKELNEHCSTHLLTVFLNSHELKVFKEECVKYSKCPNNSPHLAEVPFKLQAKTIQSKENHTFDEPEQLKTQTQFSSALKTPVSQTDTLSSKISSALDSDPNGSSITVPSSRGDHQSNLDDVASSDSNLTGHQPSVNPHQVETLDNQGSTKEISADPSISLNAHELSAQGNLDSKEHNGAEGSSSRSASVSRVDADSLNLRSATSSNVNPAATISAVESADHVVTNVQDSSDTDAAIEGKGDNTPDCVNPNGVSVDSECTGHRNLKKSVICNYVSNNETVVDGCTGNIIRKANGNTPLPLAVTPITLSLPKDTSSIVEDTGQTGNLGGGFIMVFKKNILMSLIPLAIILLLIFLVKFTPLGTLFPNKKTKKKKDMNEKLQRILQYSSVERDQGTVPFSYGSFEYSSY